MSLTAHAALKLVGIKPWIHPSGIKWALPEKGTNNSFPDPDWSLQREDLNLRKHKIMRLLTLPIMPWLNSLQLCLCFSQWHTCSWVYALTKTGQVYFTEACLPSRASLSMCLTMLTCKYASCLNQIVLHPQTVGRVTLTRRLSPRLTAVLQSPELLSVLSQILYGITVILKGILELGSVSLRMLIGIYLGLKGSLHYTHRNYMRMPLSCQSGQESVTASFPQKGTKVLFFTCQKFSSHPSQPPNNTPFNRTGQGE